MVGINRNFSSWRVKESIHNSTYIHPHTNVPNIHTNLFFFKEIVARIDLIENREIIFIHMKFPAMMPLSLLS